MVSRGLFDQTLRFYKEELHPCGLHGNNSILPSVIKACSSSAQYLHFGLQLHCIALKITSDMDVITTNSILSMYSKCCHVESARQVFDTMPIRDTITWNSMINCYIRNGYCVEAIEQFKQMCSSGLEPKPELTASIISVCSHKGDLRLGRAIHARVVCNAGIDLPIYLSTALLDMYSRCLDLDLALKVFNQTMERNEVSWTAMVAGCTRNESYAMSLEFFRAMQAEGIKPNRVTLIAVLPACTELGSIEHGKQIHGYAFRHGFESESHLAAALIDMYCKCGGGLYLATLIFERLERRDVVMWSSMIGGYSRNGDHTGAMKLFRQMLMEGVEPNFVTLLVIITAFDGLSSLSHSQVVHGYIVKSGLNSNVFVGNSLIDMYAKCGCIEASRQIFEEILDKDCVSWSALIRGYGLCGFGREALQLFHEMQERQIESDGVTLLAVLSTCCHAGLVKEGQELFNHMRRDEKTSLTVEHYACYIDLLGRSGKLKAACEVVSSMPMKPSPTIWSCLVSACKVHGQLEEAERLALQLINLEPGNAANYTLLCMVYAENGNWRGMEEVRRSMKMRGIKKSFGYSRIEPNNRVCFKSWINNI